LSGQSQKYHPRWPHRRVLLLDDPTGGVVERRRRFMNHRRPGTAGNRHHRDFERASELITLSDRILVLGRRQTATLERSQFSEKAIMEVATHVANHGEMVAALALRGHESMHNIEDRKTVP
jgi:hypothetical protein